MFCVPKALEPLQDGLLNDFTRAATARRVVFLMLAAILLNGNRTVANLLRLIGFQEMRSHLGLETTRGWSPSTVLRMAPCLFVLYTVVVVLYDALSAKRSALPLIQWNGKHHIAFSDMIAVVRCYLTKA